MQLSSQTACHKCMRPWVWSPAPRKLDTVAPIYNPSTQGGGHPQLHIKIQANLSYMKPDLGSGEEESGGTKEEKEAGRTGKGAHWVKMLAAKSDSLNLIPEPRWRKKTKSFLQVLL